MIEDGGIGFAIIDRPSSIIDLQSSTFLISP
jgi:hypothetical protein